MSTSEHKRKDTCSACKLRPVRAENQRYCKECHNEATRKYRAEIKPFIDLAKKLFAKAHSST